MQKYKITDPFLELLEKMSEDMNCVAAYDFNVLFICITGRGFWQWT